MKKVSTTIKIAPKNIDELIDRIFGSNGQDELKVVMGRVAREGLSQVEEIKKQFDDIREEYPLDLYFHKWSHQKGDYLPRSTKEL